MNEIGLVISIQNAKGGIGKTTITTNMCDILSAAGYKVLEIDMDPQGSGSQILEPLNDNGSTLSVNDILKLNVFDLLTKDVDPRQYIFKTKYRNLDIIPNARSVDDIFNNGSLATKLNRVHTASKNYMAFKNNLDKIACYYDYIIIDGQPAIDDLTLVTTIASDLVLTPACPDIYNLKTINETLNIIDYCNKNFDRDIAFLGFFLNNVQNIKGIPYQKTRKYYKQAASEYFVDTPVRCSESVNKALFGRKLWLQYYLDHLNVLPNPAKDLLKLMYKDLEIIDEEHVDNLVELGVKRDYFVFQEEE